MIKRINESDYLAPAIKTVMLKSQRVLCVSGTTAENPFENGFSEQEL